VTKKSFSLTLVRKSERALKSARPDLTDGDYDSAVNRSYYAMFDIARAALLRAGVSEDKLPRTHNGISEAFWLHAIQPGQIDQELGAELSRTESLRIKADYTGLEIEPETAEKVVEKAELFVQTVERVFGLDESSQETEYENRKPNHDDKVSEPDVAVARFERREAKVEPISLEEIRREARENWLRLRQQQIGGPKGVEPRRAADHGVQEDRSHSLHDDLDE
jgi:uncharacterized protein (UPF0332 family)